MPTPGLSHSFPLEQICTTLEYRMFMPCDVIFQEGSHDADGAYFIMLGSVVVVQKKDMKGIYFEETIKEGLSRGTSPLKSPKKENLNMSLSPNRKQVIFFKNVHEQPSLSRKNSARNLTMTAEGLSTHQENSPSRFRAPQIKKISGFPKMQSTRELSNEETQESKTKLEVKFGAILGAHQFAKALRRKHEDAKKEKENPVLSKAISFFGHRVRDLSGSFSFSPFN